MKEQEMRIAVIGGRGHHSVAKAFENAEVATLVALAEDGHDDSVMRFTKRAYCTDKVPVYKDFAKMLDEVRPDVVSIGSQPAFSGEAVIAALERGIHVVCDKPIVNSCEELETVKSLTAADPKLHLITEFVMRTGPEWRAMHDIVRSGTIGEVALVQAQKSYRFGVRPDFYKSRRSFPGIILWVGAHIIDMVYWTTGLRYTSVEGRQGNLSLPDWGDCEDHAALLFGMQNGGAAVMHMDYLRPAGAPTHADNRVRIAGSKGIVEVRDGQCVLMTADKPPHDVELPAELPGGGAGEIIAALRGKGAVSLGTADSLYIAEVLLKAREATDEGHKIFLA